MVRSSGENDLPPQGEAPLRVHAVVQNAGDFPATHLDVIVVGGARLDVPQDAASGVECPTFLRMQAGEGKCGKSGQQKNGSAGVPWGAGTTIWRAHGIQYVSRSRYSD